MTSQEECDWIVLEHIYDNGEEAKGGVGSAALSELVGEEAATDAAVGLRERGLIRKGQRLGDGYYITASGRSDVEAMRHRRTDRAHRRAACRDQLLRWVDSNTSTGPGTRVAREQFDGSADLLAFSDDETEAAAAYLHEHRLIKTISAAQADHILLWITELGREAIDSGQTIHDFISQRDGHSPTVSHTYNMSGSGNSFATATAAGAMANATVKNFNLDHARLFAAAVRAASQDLDHIDTCRSLLEATATEARLYRSRSVSFYWQPQQPLERPLLRSRSVDNRASVHG